MAGQQGKSAKMSLKKREMRRKRMSLFIQEVEKEGPKLRRSAHLHLLVLWVSQWNVPAQLSSA